MNKLEKILQSHKRPAQVIGYVSAPQCHRVLLRPIQQTTATGRPGLKTKLSHLVSLSKDVAAELGVTYVTFSTDKAGIWAEIPRDKRALVYARDLVFDSTGMGLPVILGVSVSGKVETVDLAHPASPHILIGGTSGSGKTMMLHSIVYSLVNRVSQNDVRLILIDSNAVSKAGARPPSIKSDGLGIWKQGSHVAAVRTDAPGALEALEMLVAKKNARYASASDWSLRYVVVTDELSDILSSPYHDKAILESLVDLAARGRKVGIHLVAATQRPSADEVSGAMKANFQVRIGMTVASRFDSRIIIGHDGAENLTGMGDAILRIGTRETRLQGGLVTEIDVVSASAPTTPVTAFATLCRDYEQKAARTVSSLEKWLGRK